MQKWLPYHHRTALTKYHRYPQIMSATAKSPCRGMGFGCMRQEKALCWLR
jgi:hypothetical protein